MIHAINKLFHILRDLKQVYTSPNCSGFNLCSCIKLHPMKHFIFTARVYIHFEDTYVLTNIEWCHRSRHVWFFFYFVLIAFEKDNSYLLCIDRYGMGPVVLIMLTCVVGRYLIQCFSKAIQHGLDSRLIILSPTLDSL